MITNNTNSFSLSSLPEFPRHLIPKETEQAVKSKNGTSWIAEALKNLQQGNRERAEGSGRRSQKPRRAAHVSHRGSARRVAG